MSSWPNFASVGTVYTQFPYTETDEWNVSESGVESGASYTRTNNATVLRRFTVRFSLMSRADVTTLENFFIAAGGLLGEFQFTDDEGTTWNHTRFDVDHLDFKYQEPGSHAVDVPLSATQNP